MGITAWTNLRKMSRYLGKKVKENIKSKLGFFSCLQLIPKTRLIQFAGRIFFFEQITDVFNLQNMSLWLSGRASVRGMRRSEVRFLTGTKNFSLSHARDKTKNHLSLCLDLSHVSITFCSLGKFQLSFKYDCSNLGLV